MKRRVQRLELVISHRYPQRPLTRPRLDLSSLSVDERLEVYDLTDRPRTANEEMRFRALRSRILIEEGA